VQSDEDDEKPQKGKKKRAGVGRKNKTPKTPDEKSGKTVIFEVPSEKSIGRSGLDDLATAITKKGNPKMEVDDLPSVLVKLGIDKKFWDKLSCDQDTIVSAVSGSAEAFCTGLGFVGLDAVGVYNKLRNHFHVSSEVHHQAPQRRTIRQKLLDTATIYKLMAHGNTLKEALEETRVSASTFSQEKKKDKMKFIHEFLSVYYGFDLRNVTKLSAKDLVKWRDDTTSETYESKHVEDPEEEERRVHL